MVSEVLNNKAVVCGDVFKTDIPEISVLVVLNNAPEGTVIKGE